MKRKRHLCRVTGCQSDLYLGGRCEVHHKEHRLREQETDDAVHALHFEMIDGKAPANPALLNVLIQLRERWKIVCRVTDMGQEALLAEADQARHLCIAVAKKIVAAQRAVDDGRPMPATFVIGSSWVQGQFHTLDAILRDARTEA